MDYSIVIETNPSTDDIRAIEAGLVEYNLQFAPPNPFDPLNIFVRDEANNLMGGMLGGTFWGWLYINLFWLAEPVRYQGIGGRILQMAEQEAMRRGCHHAFLDTQSFQAREFYEKYGFSVFGVLDDFPVGHQRYYLKKSLTA